MKPKDLILVVDDDPDFQSVIRRILGLKGYEVTCVSSAAEAIERLKERFYHVAILDISLPDADGTDLLSRLAEMNPDIIAIMLTGHSSVQNAVQSLNRGAFAYLEKPVDPDNLLSVISRGIEKQRLVLENRQLLDELERHNRVANTLLSVSQAVSQSLDLQEIIDSALERLAQSTGLEVSFVYLDRKGALQMMGCRGLSPRLVDRLPLTASMETGIIGVIFKNCKPSVIEDLTTYLGNDLNYLAPGGYRSFAGVPLMIVAESIGVLGVATSFAHYFSQANIELLTGIGREIAIAVRNAQLYEEASSARALRELDAMRTEFLANVSHELRTPLAVIKGSANSLLQPDVIFDEQTRREFLISIDKDADALTHLVDDLLMMSRLEADALAVNRKPHSLASIILAIKDRLDNLTVKHKLRIFIPEDLPPLNVDDRRIGEVLTNLVENAVKFSDENTTITIAAQQGEDGVYITVTDEGMGIPPELHEKIFERFFQGNYRKDGRRKGTGLGLAICKGIVETHGGRIFVESRPGNGARFVFNIPPDRKNGEN